jgi:hypothetical protein
MPAPGLAQFGISDATEAFGDAVTKVEVITMLTLSGGSHSKLDAEVGL